MNIVVTLNYNDIENTQHFVEKIKNYKYIDKIIIVDNNSTDNSKDILSKMSSRIQNDKIEILYNENNFGYASGNNMALKYANEKYNVKNFIISNPDIEISEESFSKIINKLNQKKHAAVSGLVLNPDNSIPRNFSWKLPKYRDILIETFITTTLLFQKLGISRFYNQDVTEKYKSVEVLSGCFFAIDASVFEQIGFFDESTFLYYEENNIFSSLHKLGYSSIVVTNAPLVHYGGTSTKKNINSYFKMQKIYSNSEKKYLINYLRINRLQLALYNFLFNIGKFEKYIILKLFGRI